MDRRNGDLVNPQPGRTGSSPLDEESVREYFTLLQQLVSGTARATGDEFFRTFVSCLATALRVRYAFVAEFAESPDVVRTLAFWDQDRLRENATYRLAGTPCEEVVQGKMCHHPIQVAQKFPLDRALSDWDIQSYLGVPLRNAAGTVLGHVAVMDTCPMPEQDRRSWLFHLFADRAAAELERLKMGQQLAQSEQRFRDLFEEAPIAYVYEDLETKFVSINRSAMNLLGVKPDEVPLTYGRTLVAPNQTDQSLVDDAFNDLKQGKERGFIELELRRKDNREPVWVQFWSRPDPDGLHTRTMIVDITPRVLAERERARLAQQNRYLQEEIKQQHNFEEIIGSSPGLNRVLKQVAQVAPFDSTVLITGETGTGKELIARAIHNRSQRREKPLIKLNCAALPSGLIESELFGHEKGAFTGAIEKRLGRFALANGGTIFLDEIGDMPLEAQAKLLRVLQEQEFEPIGSSKTIKVDVRVIAATNRNLQKSVEDGKFRSDLFFRINVFPIALPPLRERLTDIPLLTHYFVTKFSSKIGHQLEGVGQTAMNALLSYHWPGNIRELENIVERAVILSPGSLLEIDAETFRLVPTPSSVQPVKTAGDTSLSPRMAQTLAEGEREQILSTLEQTHWVIEGEKGAAKILGLHPNTLRSRMKKLGIEK